MDRWHRGEICAILYTHSARTRTPCAHTQSRPHRQLCTPVHTGHTHLYTDPHADMCPHATPQPWEILISSPFLHVFHLWNVVEMDPRHV